MWYWYILVFIIGGSLGCLGMAILACGTRVDDRTKIMELEKGIEERVKVIEELLKNE